MLNTKLDKLAKIHSLIQSLDIDIAPDSIDGDFVKVSICELNALLRRIAAVKKFLAEEFEDTAVDICAELNKNNS